ncbi:RNA polymerase sigma factor [Evansella cellulosilytica]|uniref:RNA polymerase, sigma-24 subunit, ECF subfamily n=1 Tax=Evansella cellulosilytica (strain ATCC 21833 / DSM 2522 / FERM P-1141 / JCM 9156 / N-4) TaxID=649639 RepID=E6TXD9_EVAC2|nr:RNA polymerase sigma factor [Evansella cellulosilytica]ADU32334.1 RNA polymerase, sigma-24 subunit, ECF subfamily [Evansella cellulosilytica DSM 2522]
MPMEEFDELYFKYSDRIYSYILLMVGDKQIAEDLTQETFVKMFRNREQFQEQSQFSTWLISIARNCTIDYLRKQKPLFLWPFDRLTSITAKDTVEMKVEKNEAVGELYRQISMLKQKYKEVIILRKIQELSIKETADILGWSEGKVKMVTHRAMEKLRLHMKEEVDVHETIR